MGEDRAQHRRADRAADEPEERCARGRDPEVAVLDGILHRDHQDLHDHAQPQS
jgi:hypothetical protein